MSGRAPEPRSPGRPRPRRAPPGGAPGHAGQAAKAAAPAPSAAPPGPSAAPLPPPRPAFGPLVPPPSVADLAGIPRRTTGGSAAVTDPTDPWVGRVISGRYRVVGKLGSGGMGEVYEAEHLTLGKSVALKIIRPELAQDEDLAARFAREALASARVEHPRMAMAIDYGPLPEGGAYLVLQRARGRSLLSVLRENGPLSWQQAAEVGAQVADALAAAHAAGIVHRDLKPENLMLDLQADGGMVVWVLDLGIARIENTVARPSTPGFTPEPLTRVGEVMGTPGYMSPEQAMGEPASPEADLYALGVVLWEMVAGRRLFPGDSLPDILTVQLTESIPILSLMKPEAEVPPGYDDVVQWLLSRRPDARPHKATLVRDALRSLLGPRDIEWPVPIFGKGWAPRGELHGVRRPASVPPVGRGGPPDLPSASAEPTPEVARARLALPPPPSPRPAPTSARPSPSAPRPAPSLSPATWLPPSVLPESARRQLPAVLVAFGVIVPAFLVATVFALLMVFLPALLAPAATEPGAAPGAAPAPAVTAGVAPAGPALVAAPAAPAAAGQRAAEASAEAASAVEPTAARPTEVEREEMALYLETLLESRSSRMRRRAAEYLLVPHRATALPEWAQAVAALEAARGCADRRAALRRIEQVGDRRARPSVARLARTPRNGCGLLEMDDCLGCIRRDLRHALRALD